MSVTRTTRRIALTSAGELFLARAQRVLGELDAARGELDELAAVLRGRSPSAPLRPSDRSTCPQPWPPSIPATLAWP